MGLLNRYLFRKASINIVGLIVFAVCVLLMERLLRIFQAVASSATPAQDATTMIVNLLPHYLGMAIPMALLLGVIITIDRFSRSSELTSALGSGVSLMHMTRPFMTLAVILSGAAFLVESIAIPMGRYQYRQALHMVKQQSYAAVLRQGTATTVENRTVIAGTEREGSAIGPVFIYEEFREDDGQRNVRITTASEGQIEIREETREVVLQLANGKIRAIAEDQSLDGDFQFTNSDFAVPTTINPYRRRGKEVRELTSFELIRNRNGEAFPAVEQNINNAALHLRLAKIFLLLLLPFIAVPFGLNYGRNPSSAGIFIGVVFIVSLNKALEFGQSLGAKGVVPPWAGIWPIIAVVAALAFVLFRKSAFKMGQPPLTTFGYWLKDLFNWLKRDVKETKDTLSQSTLETGASSGRTAE